jgi:hypothetical protein
VTHITSERVATAKICFVGPGCFLQFDTPQKCLSQTCIVGGKGKAAGSRNTRRLCCLSKRSQYKISKIKLSISMIAVTPATASTKASLASW